MAANALSSGISLNPLCCETIFPLNQCGRCLLLCPIMLHCCNMKTGKLIAIEGIDGSGKGTQTELLVNALQASSFPVEVFRFPQYETSFFGKEVGKYLHGDYGQLADVPPKFSALLYALDRFEARSMIVSALEQGKIVLCDRYTPSNMAHQSARTSADEQLNMAEWIRYVEQEVLCLPKPDLVLFLESTVQSSQTLVGLKEKRTYTDKSYDLQEASKDHLQLALDQFKKLAARENWKKVQCIDPDGHVRAPADIHRELLVHVLAALR